MGTTDLPVTVKRVESSAECKSIAKFLLLLPSFGTTSKRDSQGVIKQAHVGKVRGKNPLKGEARAARLACSVATCFAGSPICIEGDCLELVNQVQSQIVTPDWEVAGEVETIRSLLEANTSWSFSWTPREGNYAAHFLAQWCISSDLSGCISLDHLPNSVTDCDARSVEPGFVM
ncbi:hypothetical protein CJ030_MR2G004964 [Morella rubra]|uniref:RNase H type-1 domain-containing protein n=1 Tax=Morella rubra TaxID=262757 RepID=A0A6A1WH12_9ROSI|nr:hypothetical protein CJ030_MR2G004964 [Morella rubra]